MDEVIRWVQRWTRRTGMTSKESPWLPVESTACKGVAYLLKDGHIIVDGGKSGILAIKMDMQLICDFAGELMDLVETYGD